MNELHPAPHPSSIWKNQHRKPHTPCTMDGNDPDPKPCLGIPTTADTIIHPTEKDRRKNDREDDTMPHERTSPRPTQEINLKKQHRKTHPSCTMDGNDQDPKPCLEIPPPQTLLYTPQRKIDGKTIERTQCPMNESHPALHRNSI